jgi:hypothetical protein
MISPLEAQRGHPVNVALKAEFDAGAADIALTGIHVNGGDPRQVPQEINLTLRHAAQVYGRLGMNPRGCLQSGLTVVDRPLRRPRHRAGP